MGGLPILLLILASIAAAYLYTGGPYPLAYTGVSELFVVLFYGLVCSGAVYFVLTGMFGLTPLLLGLQLGLLCTIMLAINNLRDQVGDKLAQKKTLCVRFGTYFGRCEVTFLALVPFILNAGWWFLGNPIAAFLPFLTVPLALGLISNIWKVEPGVVYNQFLGKGALLHLLFGGLLGVSFVLETVA